MTGPIMFTHPTAREQLLSGEVFTFRGGEEPRTTGRTWARWSRTGPAMADVHVYRVTDAIDPREDRDVLAEYVDRSGFDSVADWIDAMRGLNGGVPDVGHVYRVAFLLARPALKTRDDWKQTDDGGTSA